MFCWSLFVLLYFFFWTLCCLFFFDIRILITPLVSSNSSYLYLSSVVLIRFHILFFSLLFSCSKKYRVVLSPSSVHVILERFFFSFRVCVYFVIKFSNSGILPFMISPSSVLDLRYSNCFLIFSMSFLLWHFLIPYLCSLSNI